MYDDALSAKYRLGEGFKVPDPTSGDPAVQAWRLAAGSCAGLQCLSRAGTRPGAQDRSPRSSCVTDG
jgi:hypothetical protein